MYSENPPSSCSYVTLKLWYFANLQARFFCIFISWKNFFMRSSSIMSNGKTWCWVFVFFNSHLFHLFSPRWWDWQHHPASILYQSTTFLFIPAFASSSLLCIYVDINIQCCMLFLWYVIIITSSLHLGKVVII